MFKGPEKSNGAAAVAPLERSAVDQHAAPVSYIGAGMSIVGNVECSGPAQVFGKIEGELRATELVIGEGAQVEGTIQAEEVRVSGRVKGTIRAIRVKLQGANVEGDITHRTLQVDENSVFEGNSRRVENQLERRGDTSDSSSAGKPNGKKVVASASVVPSAAPAGNGAFAAKTMQEH